MNARKNLFLIIAFFGTGLSSATVRSDEQDPLATLHQGHPRLLFTAEDQAHIHSLAKTDALLARVVEQNYVNAAAMLGAPTVRYEIPDGKRLLAQSRRCIERVAAMSMAYRLTGERRFAEGAIQEMLIAAEFKDWNPSHFLDTAEMTTALAIGYDWLYDEIDTDRRTKIGDAIVRLGLSEGLKVYKSGGGWVVRDNNWNQVCNGGMILGALAIAEDEPEVARQVVQYAVKSVPHGTQVYQPSGAYPEGPGYWQYGTTYTCLTMKALQTALGTDFGMSKTPGLDRTGWYRIHTIGPTGWSFNYADGGAGTRTASAMFLLSQLYDEPIFAWWHRERLSNHISSTHPTRPNSPDRFFAMEIAWYDPRGEQPSDDQLPLDALFDSRQDIVTMRSAWHDPGAIYVGFKGGDNRTNHGHLDIGSFVLDADGVRWALDLGRDDYNMPGYFGGQRWQYYRMTNRSHNTLVIDGQIQNPSARCDVTKFHTDPRRAAVVVDMTAAYKGQAKSVVRGIELLDRRAVHVRDEITGADGDVRWGMVTAAEVQLDGRRALLRQDGKTLQADILAPPGARFELASTQPPTKREQQNAGTRILAVNLVCRPDERAEISVLLQPLHAGREAFAAPPKPLNEW